MKILLLACLLAAMAAAIPSAPEKGAQILQAIRKGDNAAVIALAESQPGLVDTRGADGVPAVRLALYYRHPEIARTLIERGAQLDIYDAAAAGQPERLRERVINDPAAVNSRSTDGATPLGLAAFFGHRDAVEFLLDHGAQINLLATNPAFPFTALHSAMSAGHKEIVSLLLARGADVNVREGGGITVLHEAAALGHLEYVRLLLARNANPNAKTDEGKLPEDFARERNFGEVVELLVQARSK